MPKQPLYPHVPKQKAPTAAPQTGSVAPRLWDVIDKYYAKYNTLEKAEAAARKLKLTPSGTRREIVIDIVAELLVRALAEKR